MLHGKKFGVDEARPAPPSTQALQTGASSPIVSIRRGIELIDEASACTRPMTALYRCRHADTMVSLGKYARAHHPPTLVMNATARGRMPNRPVRSWASRLFYQAAQDLQPGEGLSNSSRFSEYDIDLGYEDKAAEGPALLLDCCS